MVERGGTSLDSIRHWQPIVAMESRTVAAGYMNADNRHPTLLFSQLRAAAYAARMEL